MIDEADNWADPLDHQETGVAQRLRWGLVDAGKEGRCLRRQRRLGQGRFVVHGRRSIFGRIGTSGTTRKCQTDPMLTDIVSSQRIMLLVVPEGRPSVYLFGR